MSAQLVPAATVALGFGSFFGFVHFSTLGMLVDRFIDGRYLAAAGLQLARLLLLGAVFAAVAWFGALPLLACLAGLLIGRRLALRRARIAS